MVKPPLITSIWGRVSAATGPENARWKNIRLCPGGRSSECWPHAIRPTSSKPFTNASTRKRKGYESPGKGRGRIGRRIRWNAPAHEWRYYSDSMVSAALRSPGLNFKKIERAFLMSVADPVAAAA